MEAEPFRLGAWEIAVVLLFFLTLSGYVIYRLWRRIFNGKV